MVFIEFDPAKDAANRAKHGVSLTVAAELEWDRVAIRNDLRHPYGEARRIAFAPRDGRLYVLVFVLRGDSLRAISLRRANAREVRLYAEGQD